MDILLSFRKQPFRNESISMFLHNFMGLQVICFALNPVLDPLSLKIADLFLIFLNPSRQYRTSSIIINFIFSISVTLLVILTMVLKQNRFSFQLAKTLSLMTGIFKYILLLPTVAMNTEFAIRQNPKHIVVFCIFNILIAIVLGFFELYCNWSNRFEQKDFCNRRQNPVVVYILLILFIIAQSILDGIIGSVFLVLYSLFSFYQITTYMEFSFVQKNTIFYSLINLYVALFVVIGKKEEKIRTQVLAYNLLFGWIILKYCTQKIRYFIDYRQSNLKKIFSYKLSLDDNERNMGAGEDSDEKNKKGKNDLFFLSKIFHSRKETGSLLKNDENRQQYKFWSKEYNEVLLFHMATCSITDCICRQKIGDWESQVIISEMACLLGKNIKQNQKGVSIKVTAIYFYVEIAQKPLKAYYQIMRMKRQKNNIPDSIDLECLIAETRECFDQIFLKNNVQNNNLPLLKVIQFENFIQQLELDLRSTLQININFLQLFMQNSVKISQVVSESNQIFYHKQKIATTLEHLVLEYPDNPRIQMIIFIFYQFVEVYRSREKQFKNFNQEKIIKKRMFDKNEDDIFKPEYGAIYIDLIEERGKIQKITKNLCKAFGYNIEDMISFNINQFMPRIYGKHHAKFLANFIDNGAIKILKEKRRILFGKNKNKFIFPIQARLKTQHLYDRQFGASGLIKSIQTQNGYIIVGVNGKIEEISQNVYEKLFAKVLKNQVDKTRRFCIYKMIPEFVKIIKNQNFDSLNKRVYQSVAIFSQDPSTLLEKFKIYRQSKKNGSSQSGIETSRSASYSDSEYSTTTGVQNKNFDINHEFCIDSFRNLLIDLNYFKLLSMKISFKVSKLRTNQFELAQIQIINFGNVENDVLGIINVYKQFAYYLGIFEDESPIDINFKKYLSIIESNDIIGFALDSNVQQIEKTTENNDNKKKCQKTLKLIKGNHEFDEEQSVIKDNFSQSAHLFNERQNNLNHNIRGTSERSSVTDSSQSQSKKQMLINSFNISQMKISTQMGCCLVFTSIMIIILIIFVIWTITTMEEMRNKSIEQNLTLNISQIYEYRLSLSEIQDFYRHRMSSGVILDPNTLQKMQEQKTILTSLFTRQIQNLDDENQNIDFSHLNLTMKDTLTNQSTKINFISLFNRLQFTFQHQYQPNNLLDLRTNYQNIHLRMNQFHQQNYQTYKQFIHQYQFSQLALFVVYEVILLGISVVAIYAYHQFKNKQKKIINLLTTINTREIKRAKLKLKILWQNFKLSKINNLSNVVQTLNHDVDTEIDNEGQQPTRRNIKLIYDGDNQQLSNSVILILVLFFIIIFSAVPVAIYSSLITNIQIYTNTVKIISQSYQLQGKVPLFINLYLSHINNILSAQSFKTFSQQLYTQAASQYFQLTDHIANETQKNVHLKDIKNQGIWQDICNLIDCNTIESENDLKLGYHVLDLKNKFHILSPQEMGIKEITSAQVHEWATENNMDESLRWVYIIFQFSQQWNKVVKEHELDSINDSQYLIYIMVGVMVPVYILLLVVIAYKIIKKLNGIVKNAQNIHMHFPPNILSENTYLTSYFSDKIKNNK